LGLLPSWTVPRIFWKQFLARLKRFAFHFLELLQALQKSKPQSRDQKMPDLWATRRAEIVRDTAMER